MLAPSPFGLVCFRHLHPGMDPDEADAHNRALLARVNATGRVYLSHTALGGRYAIRMSIGQWQTERADVERAWAAIRGAAHQSSRRMQGTG